MHRADDYPHQLSEVLVEEVELIKGPTFVTDAYGKGSCRQQLTRLRQGPGFRPANALDRPPGASFSASLQIQRRAELIGPTQRLLVANAH